MDPLKRPLTFGDREQIDALHTLALAKEYDGLTDCERCEGDGLCRACGDGSCPNCEGTGKEKHLYEQFMRLNGLTGFQMSEVVKKAR
jgi:DnaJ-class molecular chaperone